MGIGLSHSLSGSTASGRADTFPPRNWGGEARSRPLLVLFIVLMVLLPLVQLPWFLLEALIDGVPLGLSDPGFRRQALSAALHSLETGAGGTLIACALGLSLATLTTMVRLRWRQTLVFCFVLQAMLPPQVVALAWLQLWSPLRDVLVAMGASGLADLSNPLQTRWGIMALLGIHYAPLVFLTARAGLMNIPLDVIEAARTCGARPWTILVKVVWPLMTPATAAGATMAFVSCVGNFGIPAFLGIPGDYLVLPTLIYQELSGFGGSALPRVTALAALVAMLAAFGLLMQHLLVKEGHYRVMSKHMDEAPFSLGRAEPWLILPTLTLVLLLLIAPLTALLVKSLAPALGVPLEWGNLSLQHYRYVLSNEATLSAFANSLFLSSGAVLVLGICSVVLAYHIEYRRHRLLTGLAKLLEFAYVTPGVVLAMAMILLYLRPIPIVEISIYNTIWIIFLAYLARFFTLQLRPVLSGFQQIPREILEAAEVFGSRFISRFWHVLVPLLAPAMGAGALLSLMLAMNELTVSALLWASGSETLGVVVFGLEQGGESAAASALGVLSIVLVLALMLVASVFGRSLPVGALPWRA
jgi:iron(III) transport system permease protein